jgi:hypothetical protein
MSLSSRKYVNQALRSGENFSFVAIEAVLAQELPPIIGREKCSSTEKPQ